MSLQPADATRTIDEQDRREYATQVMFRNIYNSIPVKKRGALFGIREMRRIREEWGLDFSKEGFTIADFTRLAEVLPPNPEFDSARRALVDSNYIKRTVGIARREYDGHVENNLYPVMLLDPQIQGVSGVNRVATFYAFTRGESIRSMDRGDTRTIYREDGSVLYDSGNQTAQTTSVGVPEGWSSGESSVEQGETGAEDSHLRVHGWTSGEQTLGLDNVLGAYFTRSDQEKLRKHFDGENIAISPTHAEYLDNSLEIVKYLRSNGIDFEVEDFYQRGQIDIKLAGTDTSVRIFDLDDKHPGRYIGRVYDSFGFVHVQANQQNRQLEYSPEESIIPLKLTLGHIDGEYQKVASNANTQVHRVDGLGTGKHVFIGRQSHQNRYDSVIYLSDEDATEYLQGNIDGANAYLESQFKLEDLNELMADEEWLESRDEEVLDSVLSYDLKIRERQLAYINDVLLLSDTVDAGLVDEMLPLMESFNPEDVDSSAIGTSREDIEQFVYSQIQSEMVGSLEDGFNPAFVIEHAPEHDVRHHSRNATMAALRHLEYDLDKLKGNEFATQNVKDNLVTFDPETGRTIDEVDDDFLKNAMIRVQENLTTAGVIGADKENPPEVLIDEQGVIYWEGHRTINKPNRRAKLRDNIEELSPNGKRIEKQLVSGEIGQVFSPNDIGIIKTDFASGGNYGFVPGYTGFFKFDGEYTDDRMDRFRVKGFEQHLNEKIDTLVRQQVSRPLKEHWENIPNHFDSSELNSLYHGDVYGRRIELDFVEKSMLSDETTHAIVKSLANRVRFGNEYNDHATTNAEARSKWDTQHEDQAAFSYWKAAGEVNMRVLDDDLVNIADLTMTGNARTQGLSWYLVDGAKVTTDGVVIPSQGDLQIDGTFAPDKSAIRRLDYFKFEDHNAWNRVQMSANQLITAKRVDEGVGTAMATFGGWTYEDSFAVSKEFSDRNRLQGDVPNEQSMKELNQVVRRIIDGEELTKEDIHKEYGVVWSTDTLVEGVIRRKNIESSNSEISEKAQKDYQKFLEENGTFRPLRRGDKLSDFGGNKGTIGIVIDRNMDLAEAKRQGLEREVVMMNANPDLDVLAAPYSPLSRFNSGIIRELQSGKVTDLYDPLGNNGDGKTMQGAMGRLNFIVTDLTVDEKTSAYTEADVADGKGRKASGQLAWALQAQGAVEILKDIYGNNNSAWSTMREYFIVTGLDLDSDGTLRVGYEPHDETEIRKTFHYADYESSDEFLNEISDQGGFLEVPFEMELLTGEKTNKIPILSAALRQNTELVDGTMRRSDFNNYYTQMFKNIKEYVEFDSRVPYDEPHKEEKRLDRVFEAKANAQKYLDNVQTEIKERQFDGGFNGKHSYLRDNIMGVRLKNSATGVAISDPRISITQVGMDSDMMTALDIEEKDNIIVWRDPIWREFAVSGREVIHDESVHGVSINPATMAPMDGDLDGDQLGAGKLNSKAAIREAKTLLAQENNMVDTGSANLDLFLPDDQDFASAMAEARLVGDTRLDDLRESIDKNARSNDERLRRKAVVDSDKYIQVAFREMSYGSDYINLTDRDTVYESLNRMVERRAKGSPDKLDTAMDYYDGKMGRKEAKDIQYAKGVQTDDTGLGGAVSQELVSAMRNQGIQPALEVSYPVTQAILQIRHSAEHARTIDGLARKEIPNLYAGKSSDGKQKNVTKAKWVNDYHKVLTEDLGVDVRKELVESVADVMAGDGNIIRPIDDVIEEKASPMDQIGYGGGWDKAFDLAKKGNQSLLDGEMNQYFAPKSIRENSGKAFARSDVRDRKAEEEMRELIEKRNFKKELEEHNNSRKVNERAYGAKVEQELDDNPTVAVDEGFTL